MQFLLYRQYNHGQIIWHKVKKLSKILQDHKAMIFTLAHFLTLKHDYRKLFNLELFISLYFCIKVLRKTLEVIKEKYLAFAENDDTLQAKKSKEIKQNWREPEKFDILAQFLTTFSNASFSEREIVVGSISTNFKIFLMFLNLLKCWILSFLATCDTSAIPCFLYYISSTALLVANTILSKNHSEL